MVNTEHEIWKTYPEFDFIEVSNLGRVRTVDRVVTYKNGAKHFYKGHILKQQLDRYGYLYVSFSCNRKNFYRKVHRMVLITFCPNSDNLPEVNHIDCDRTNNRLDNLEWCSREYNTAYREKYGKACNHPVFAVDLNTGKVLKFESQSEAARQLGVDVRNLNKVIKGEQNQTGGYWFTEDESEITEEKIREIRVSMQPHPVIAVNPETSEVFWFKSQSEAGRRFDVYAQHVNAVVKGRQHNTHGLWFCYADKSAFEKTRMKFGDEMPNKVKKLINEHLN